jgi:hypothetical protein
MCTENGTVSESMQKFICKFFTQEISFIVLFHSILALQGSIWFGAKEN